MRGSQALWGEALENLSAAAEFPADLAEFDATPQSDLCTVLLFQICRPPEDQPAIPVVAVFADRGMDKNQAWAEHLRQAFSTGQARKTLSAILGGHADKLTLGPIGGSSEPGKLIKPHKIAIRTEGKIVFIDPAEVTVIEAQGNYVLLQTRSRSYLLRESLSIVGERLEPYGFIRIHRSTIVNQAVIEEIQISRSGEMVLRLTGIAKVYAVSRKYRDVLKSIAPCWI